MPNLGHPPHISLLLLVTVYHSPHHAGTSALFQPQKFALQLWIVISLIEWISTITRRWFIWLPPMLHRLANPPNHPSFCLCLHVGPPIMWVISCSLVGSLINPSIRRSTRDYPHGYIRSPIKLHRIILISLHVTCSSPSSSTPSPDHRHSPPIIAHPHIIQLALRVVHATFLSWQPQGVTSSPTKSHCHPCNLAIHHSYHPASHNPSEQSYPWSMISTKPYIATSLQHMKNDHLHHVSSCHVNCYHNTPT